MADIQASITELQESTAGIKSEILDIKENLAGYDVRMDTLETDVAQERTNIRNFVKNSISSCVSKDSLAQSYYDIDEIDAKFGELDYVTIGDVETYLDGRDYLTSSSLGGYVDMPALEEYVSQSLEDYVPSSVISSTYVNKSELEESLNDMKVDLTPYVTHSHLEDYYYTKEDVDRRIPSVTGFVKKSELLTLLPLNEYALVDYVDNTFVTKKEFSSLKYVTPDALDERLSDYSNMVSTDEVTGILKSYVRRQEFDNRLNEFNDALLNVYIPSKMDEFRDLNKFLTEDKASGLYVTKNEIRDILNSPVEWDEEVFSGFITKEELDERGYVSSPVLDDLKNTIISDVVNNIIPKKTDKFITADDVEKTYATKDEIRNYIINRPDGSVSVDLSDYVKIDEMDNYVKVATFKNEMSVFEKKSRRDWIPVAIEDFRKSHDYIEKEYGDSTYMSKTDFKKYAESVNDMISSLNLDEYVSRKEMQDVIRQSDMSNYVLKSDMVNYVPRKTYDNDMSNTDTRITSLAAQFKKYVRQDSLDITLEDYVTKSYLDDELKKWVEDGRFDTIIDTSGFLTREYDDSIKNYIAKELSGYSRNTDVFSKRDIMDGYFTKQDVLDAFYTREESDDRFMTKSEIGEKYLSVIDAYSEFLSKDDYRGIKDAMTLSGAYKNAPEMFDTLLADSKIYDGFYIIGDNITVVKDGVPYRTNLTGSDSYTRNEIDDMFSGFVESNKPLNWIEDKGGNY